MIVQKSSIFPADADTVWRELQKLSTLQYIAAPYATFEPVKGGGELVWREGETFAFYFKLFGAVPMGIHEIHIETFAHETFTIQSREHNPHVPTWDHRIWLEPSSSGVRYTDRVEIRAGWKTPFIWCWANFFYAHRQRKWMKLLKGMTHER